MARGHGRILSSIWDDEDFTSLGEEEQRLYFFLLSQTNLNHAGLLPVTLLRWSRKAKGLTPALLSDRLRVLEDARFVVVDPETEELLIRSYVRNDGVWKQPNVMAAMVSASQEIESPKLRRVLLAEMDRLPLDLLSDEPSMRGGPSTRKQVEAHVANLRRTLRVPEPGLLDGSYGIPSQNPSERVPETPTEAMGEPSTHADTRADTRAAPSPPPSPTPAPSSSPSPGAPAADLEADPPMFQGGGGDQDPTETAIAYLEALPQPWTVGRVTAKALAPNLIVRVQERRWQLGPDLTAELTKNAGGIASHREVLRARIDDLAFRLLPTATQSGRPCSRCEAEGRTLTDNGICLPCSSAAGQRAPRPDSLRKASLKGPVPDEAGEVEP